jgi:DNA-directed RNA polymerase delta subunit
MNESRKEPIDFLKVIEGIETNKKEELKEALKQLRTFYLELIEAGFTMQEAMAFLAALTIKEKT